MSMWNSTLLFKTEGEAQTAGSIQELRVNNPQAQNARDTNIKRSMRHKKCVCLKRTCSNLQNVFVQIHTNVFVWRELHLPLGLQGGVVFPLCSEDVCFWKMTLSMNSSHVFIHLTFNTLTDNERQQCPTPPPDTWSYSCQQPPSDLWAASSGIYLPIFK